MLHVSWVPNLPFIEVGFGASHAAEVWVDFEGPSVAVPRGLSAAASTSELGEQRAQVLRPHAGAVGPLGAHVDRTDIAE